MKVSEDNKVDPDMLVKPTSHSFSKINFQVFQADIATCHARLEIDDFTSGILTVSDGANRMQHRIRFPELICLRHILNQWFDHEYPPHKAVTEKE